MNEKYKMRAKQRAHQLREIGGLLNSKGQLSGANHGGVTALFLAAHTQLTLSAEPTFILVAHIKCTNDMKTHKAVMCAQVAPVNCSLQVL